MRTITIVYLAIFITVGRIWAGFECTTAIDGPIIGRLTTKAILDGDNLKTDIPQLPEIGGYTPIFLQFGLIGGLLDAWSAHHESESKSKLSLPKNGYGLSNDGGKTMHIVNMDKKTFSTLTPERFSLKNMQSQIEARLPKGKSIPQMDMSIVNPKIDKVLEEPGPTMFGHSTTHTKIHATYTLEMTVMGRKHSTPMVFDYDFWSTEEIAAPTVIHDETEQIKKFDDPAAFSYRIGRQVRGFHLKTVSVTSGGVPFPITVRTEVIDLKEVVLPNGTFEIPAGFKEQPFSEMLGISAPDSGK